MTDNMLFSSHTISDWAFISAAVDKPWGTSFSHYRGKQRGKREGLKLMHNNGSASKEETLYIQSGGNLPWIWRNNRSPPVWVD